MSTAPRPGKSRALARACGVGAAWLLLLLSAVSGWGQLPVSTDILGIVATERVDTRPYTNASHRWPAPNQEFWLTVTTGPYFPPGHVYTVQVTVLGATNDPYGTASPYTTTEVFSSDLPRYIHINLWTPRAYGQRVIAYYSLLADQVVKPAAGQPAAPAAGAQGKSGAVAAVSQPVAPVRLSAAGSNPVIVNAKAVSAPTNRLSDGSRAPLAGSGKKTINADDPPPAARRGPSSRPGLTIINSEGEDDASSSTPSPRPRKKKPRSSD